MESWGLILKRQSSQIANLLVVLGSSCFGSIDGSIVEPACANMKSTKRHFVGRRRRIYFVCGCVSSQTIKISRSCVASHHDSSWFRIPNAQVCNGCDCGCEDGCTVEGYRTNFWGSDRHEGPRCTTTRTKGCRAIFFYFFLSWCCGVYTIHTKKKHERHCSRRTPPRKQHAVMTVGSVRDRQTEIE